MKFKEHLKTSIFEMVYLEYIVLAIGIAIFSEFILIISESFIDFPTVGAGIQLYFVFTVVALSFWMIVSKIGNITILMVWLKSTVFIVLPIGFAWAIFQNYHIWGELLDPVWLILHDTVYVVLVSQFIVSSVMMIGIKDYMVVSE